MMIFLKRIFLATIRYQISFFNAYNFTLIDGTLSSITNPDKSEPDGNDHEKVLHTPHISRTETTPLDAIIVQAKTSNYFGHLLLYWREIQRIISLALKTILPKSAGI